MAQKLARDEAGNVWDVSTGQPRLVRAAGSDGPNVMVPAPPKDPPKPEFVPGHPGLVMTPGRDGKPTVQSLPGVPQSDKTTYHPLSPAEVQQRGLDPQHSWQVGSDGKVEDLGPKSGGGKTLDPSVRQKAIQGYQFSQALQQRLDELHQLFDKGPGATHGIMGTADYLPLTANKEFDSASDGARAFLGQTLQFTGGQLNTDKESERNLGPYLPHASDRDQVVKDKLARLQDLVNTGKNMSVQTLGGIPDAQGNITPVQHPSAQIDPKAATANPQLGLNGDNKTRAQIDPMLRSVGNHVGVMIASGEPDEKIRKFLSDSGVDPANTNIDAALNFRKTDDFKRWQRSAPGEPYPIGADFYTKQVPVSDARRLFNKTAATDIGGKAAATAVAAGNSMLGDRGASLVGAISGDPEMAKLGMDTLRQQHPGMSLLGDIAGQAVAESAVGAIPGAQGLLATRWGRRTADAGYGVYSGSGDDSNGDPVTGGLLGGAFNLGGGAVGRSLQRGVGRTLSGVKNANLQYLDNLGIPLTPGRIGHGSENKIGKGVGGIEDRLAGLPGFDAVIGAARKRGDEAFNSAAFKEAGGSGVTGAAGLDEINTLKNNAYGFLNGTDIPLDAQFAGRNAAIQASIPAMPSYGKEVGLTLGQLNDISKGGTIGGRDWQSALRAAKADRASITGEPFADKATGAMKEVENNLLGLADRQGPAGTVDNLNAANRLHAQGETLAAALDNGPTQRAGQLFSAQRLDDASRNGARKFGGRLASLTGNNRPFYQLSQAGLDVMPNLTPDSGTAGRMAVLGTLAGLSAGGAGVGALLGGDDRVSGAEQGSLAGPGYLGALTLAGLLYSKNGQKIAQKLLLGDRSPTVQKLGDYLINKTGAAGKIGSGLARAYNYSLASLAQ